MNNYNEAVIPPVKVFRLNFFVVNTVLCRRYLNSHFAALSLAALAPRRGAALASGLSLFSE